MLTKESGHTRLASYRAESKKPNEVVDVKESLALFTYRHRHQAPF